MFRTLEAMSLARAIREGTTLYPAIETLHIIGLALLVGSIVLFDLRVLGRMQATLPLRPLADHALPPAWIGFTLAAATGSLMFIADASALANNPAFRTKLVLIVLAGVNVMAFHRNFGKDPPRLREKLSAGLSLVLWTVILVCGRLIAYL